MAHQEILLREFEPPDDATLSLLPSLRALLNALPDSDVTFELLARSLINGLYDTLTLGAPEGRLPSSRRKVRS
jgi:hypothetical protein